MSHSTCPPSPPPPHANSFIIGPAVINTHTPGACVHNTHCSITHESDSSPCVKVPGSSRVPAPPWVGSRSPDGWDQIPYRTGGWVFPVLKYRVPHGSHDRFGSSSHVQQNGCLSHPQDLDAPLRIAVVALQTLRRLFLSRLRLSLAPSRSAYVTVGGVLLLPRHPQEEENSSDDSSVGYHNLVRIPTPI